MVFAMYVTFYASVACYIIAALVALGYLRNANPCVVTAAELVLGLGVLGSVSTLALRWIAFGHLPLTTMTDSLNLFAIMAAAVMLWIVLWHRVPALLCFYLPPLALICAVNAAAGYGNLHLEPRALNGPLLIIHVGLAFWAYALFFVAGMTSVAYIFRANRLKNHRTSGLFRHLPSLEELDKALFRLIGYGYPFFVVTLTLGLLWAFWDRAQLGAYWWLAPKVVLSYLMAVFYAGTFHMRRLGRLRGPKLANLVFWGFVLLIAGYILLSVLNLRAYHFWSGTT